MENNNYNTNYNNYNYYNNVNNNNINNNNMNNSINNSMNKTFNYYGRSDIGKVSKINEDLVAGFTLLNENVMCLIVADGLGSIVGGQFSSVVAVEEIKKYLEHFLVDSNVNYMKQILYNAIYTTNRVVSNYRNINPELYSSFTSTITIALVNKNKEMVVGHLGNSRLYILRGGEIYQITRDDTIARDLIDKGKISEEDYRTHPDRGHLNKFLGDPLFEPYINIGTVQKDDLLLLCTNGLYEMLLDEDIKNIMYEEGNSKDACEKLIENANELGGIDNIGVIISYIDF